MAGSFGIPFVDDNATTETQALLDDLILAEKNWMQQVLVELDCMEVVEVMQQGGISICSAAGFKRSILFYVAILIM